MRDLWDWVLLHRLAAGAAAAAVVLVAGGTAGYLLTAGRRPAPTVASRGAVASPSVPVRSDETPTPAAAGSPTPAESPSPTTAATPAASPSPISVTGSGPAARRASQSCFDTHRDELVLFGGYIDTVHLRNDTWLWHSGSWTQAKPATSPPAQGNGLMAYDDAADVCVLIGGYNGTSTNTATWTWNGTNWAQAASTLTPPLDGGVMAYDPALSKLVLVSAVRSTSIDNPQTWTWAPDGWTQLATVHYPPRSQYGAAAYDAVAHDLVVVAGGGTGATTWFLRNGDWVQLAAPSPVVSSDFVMATSALPADRAVLQSNDGTTWGFDGSQWAGIGSLPSGSGISGFYLDAAAARDLLLIADSVGANGPVAPALWAWTSAGWNSA